MLVHRLADFLASVPLFSRLSTDERRGFAALAREQRYPRGALIVRQGDPGDALYVLRSGSVKVAIVGDDGREVILDTLGQGAHFGELALIDGRPRSAHVVAVDPAVLLVLRREDFRREVERQTRVAWALLEELSRRLRDADEKITALVLLDVPGRVARLLLDRATGTPPTIERAPTHETMAQMIGASRETVSRAMRELQDAGLIEVERRMVRVLDQEGLARRGRPGATPSRAARGAARPAEAPEDVDSDVADSDVDDGDATGSSDAGAGDE
ncbi:cyclic nucleotide-binding protein [Gemmatirosa kalamazoonensis]|uniref:Cyclic nucleotide-binding protein n=1 Tax=Gemmatirosa kalamazoonensis TaxID=861299 RepID=W0RJ65_9BACT|nr:Crp/Fnr family transcriptional regulator [Gemmatirosa kalamazoonensis]AHG90472.1 cyclic nucleotide-binding protein [Gemmatirosa kalamazoonensis]